jgi:hypothetical protein
MKLMSDNTVTCYCLGKAKASSTLVEIVDKILKHLEKENWRITTEHLPGLNNTKADSLSRLAASGDYSIKWSILFKVLHQWKV